MSEIDAPASVSLSVIERGHPAPVHDASTTGLGHAVVGVDVDAVEVVRALGQP